MKTHLFTTHDLELIRDIQGLLEANRPLRQYVAHWIDDESGPRSIAVLARSQAEARSIIEDVTGAVSLQIVSR